MNQGSELGFRGTHTFKIFCRQSWEQHQQQLLQAAVSRSKFDCFAGSFVSPDIRPLFWRLVRWERRNGKEHGNYYNGWFDRNY